MGVAFHSDGCRANNWATRMVGGVKKRYADPRWQFVHTSEDIRQWRCDSSQPGCVCEYQYESVRPMVADRVDLLVWLDPPTPLVMWRVTRRTVVRGVRRQELWNGNREPRLREVLTDPEHVVRWSREVQHWLGGPLSEVL